MQYEKTICYGVAKSLELLEEAMNTNTLDAGRLAKLLHGIRSQAQVMENGLKLRKEMMIANGLEAEYQKKKGKQYTPTGINKIASSDEIRADKEAQFRVTIEKDGEILYQNNSKGGVLCTVEKVTDIDSDGVMEGQTQKFMYGHTMAWWFAFDQLRISIEGKKFELLAALKGHLGPAMRKKLLNALQ